MLAHDHACDEGVAKRGYFASMRFSLVLLGFPRLDRLFGGSAVSPPRSRQS